MPRVFKILRRRSSDGVDIVRWTMTLMATTSTISYNIAKDFPIRYIKLITLIILRSLILDAYK